MSKITPSSNLVYKGGNLARNWLCVHGQWLYQSLFLTCTFWSHRFKEGGRKGGTVQRSRDGHRKSKHGNQGLERIGVTVSPGLWVWRSEEERRNMVMVFSQNRDVGNCCHWQDEDINLTRFGSLYSFKSSDLLWLWLGRLRHASTYQSRPQLIQHKASACLWIKRAIYSVGLGIIETFKNLSQEMNTAK